MRVKRNSLGYTLFVTDHEFALLNKFVPQDIEEHWKGMTSGEKRSWSRRVRHGSFLRVDRDNRDE